MPPWYLPWTTVAAAGECLGRDQLLQTSADTLVRRVGRGRATDWIGPFTLAVMRSPRYLRVAALCVPVLALIAVVVLSPLVLRFVTADGVDWDRASAIGQTYGAASALLSAIALAGIGISIVLQARANDQARVQAVRQMHSDLLKMALDDPMLLSCWGPGPCATDLDERQAVYVNLILSDWQARWDLGLLNEQVLRTIADSLFRGEASRKYWFEFGAYRLASAAGPDRARVVRILDEQYQQAVASGPPERPAIPRPRPRADIEVEAPRREKLSIGVVVAGGALAVGAVVLGAGLAWRRPDHHSQR